MNTKNTNTQTPHESPQSPHPAPAVQAEPLLLSALQECRDILCALHARPESLPYLLGKDIPIAIKRGYLALQAAGLPNAQDVPEANFGNMPVAPSEAYSIIADLIGVRLGTRQEKAVQLSRARQNARDYLARATLTA